MTAKVQPRYACRADGVIGVLVQGTLPSRLEVFGMLFHTCFRIPTTDISPSRASTIPSVPRNDYCRLILFRV